MKYNKPKKNDMVIYEKSAKILDLEEDYTHRLRHTFVKIKLCSEIYFNLLIHLYFCSLTSFLNQINKYKVIMVLKDSTL